MSLVTFSPDAYDQFFYKWKILPFVELKDITLKDTRNANFIATGADTVNISNVYLEGLSMKDVKVTYPAFYFSLGHSMNVYNLTAKNVSGPLIQTVNVLAQNFSTFSLTNMYASQQLKTSFQGVIFIAKVENVAQKGLDVRKSLNTYLDNINLNVSKIFRLYS